ELPLWGPGSPAVGLDVGQPLALVLELLIAALGLGAFLMRTTLGMARRVAIGGLTLVVAGLSIFAATATAHTTDILSTAGTSLLALFVIVTIAAACDRET